MEEEEETLSRKLEKGDKRAAGVCQARKDEGELVSFDRWMTHLWACSCVCRIRQQKKKQTCHVHKVQILTNRWNILNINKVHWDFLVFPLMLIFLFPSAVLLGQFSSPMDWLDGTSKAEPIHRGHPIILNAEICFVCGFSCQAALAQGKVYKKYVFAFNATGH